MKKILLFLFPILAASAPCFAQNDQTESISISTYYPSPAGVYKTLQLYPATQPSGSGPDWAGTMFFNTSDNTTYIYTYNISSGTGKWDPIGSGGSGASAAGQIDSGHEAVPDICPGVKDASTYTGFPAPQCSELWYTDITFNTTNATFTRAPKVIVTVETGGAHGLGRRSCSGFGNRGFFVNATNITSAGFRIWAGGNGNDLQGCLDAPVGQRRYTPARVSWMAVGE